MHRHSFIAKKSLPQKQYKTPSYPVKHEDLEDVRQQYALTVKKRKNVNNDLSASAPKLQVYLSGSSVLTGIVLLFTSGSEHVLKAVKKIT